jgi:hypothetical protein
MNARKYNVFVSVNAIAGRRTRTRDAIREVRHVFLDADHDGRGLLSRLETRRDLPIPTYVLHSSPNHIHGFWRVTGFAVETVERLQSNMQSSRATIRSTHPWLTMETTGSTALSPGNSPSTQISTHGEFNSPR